MALSTEQACNRCINCSGNDGGNLCGRSLEKITESLPRWLPLPMVYFSVLHLASLRPLGADRFMLQLRTLSKVLH